MCVYSAISDWGRDRWGDHTGFIPRDPGPNQAPVYPTTVPSVPTVTITQSDWDAFKCLLDAAKKFDDVTGQPDCESAEKTAWMKEIEEKLAKLTEKVG